MLKKNLMEKLEKDPKFEYRTVEYKSQEDKDKYGLSFEAITKNDFEEVIVNGETYKAKRIIEEFGLILMIYNFNQVEFKPKDIETFEVL